MSHRCKKNVRQITTSNFFRHKILSWNWEILKYPRHPLEDLKSKIIYGTVIISASHWHIKVLHRVILKSSISSSFFISAKLFFSKLPIKKFVKMKWGRMSTKIDNFFDQWFGIFCVNQIRWNAWLQGYPVDYLLNQYTILKSWTWQFHKHLYFSDSPKDGEDI